MKKNLKKPKWGVKTEWVPIEQLPKTPDGITEIAIDLETKDPRLKSHGPGWATGHGDVVGFAVAYKGFNAYLPTKVGEIWTGASSCAGSRKR